MSAPSERAGQLRKLPRTQALLRTHTHLGPGSCRLTLKRVSCHAQGGGPAPSTRPRSPAQLTSFCPAPSKHLGKPANGSPGREAQRGGAPGPACAQGSPVRCGCARCRQARPAAVVRAHTHTSTRAQRCLRSAHTQLAQLPYPPAPPPPRLPFQRSFGQLKIVNRPTPQTSALFSGPQDSQGLWGPHEQYLSDPWAPGHAILCGWKPE